MGSTFYLWEGKFLIVDGKFAVNEDCCCGCCEGCFCTGGAGTPPKRYEIAIAGLTWYGTPVPALDGTYIVTCVGAPFGGQTCYWTYELDPPLNNYHAIWLQQDTDKRFDVRFVNARYTSFRLTQAANDCNLDDDFTPLAPWGGSCHVTAL